MISLRGLFIAACVTGLMGVAEASTVKLTAEDGTRLTAEREGSGASGVVLVHGDGGSSADWKSLVGRLASNGYSVLAVDLRGHGGSKPPDSPADDDYLVMEKDVNAAVVWLKKNGSENITVIGASLGANVALAASASNDAIDSVVMISPTLSAKGVKASAAIGALGNRSLMLVASDAETLQAKAVQLLSAKAQGPNHAELLSAAGSGTRLLNTAPELEGLLFAWLNGSLLTNATGSRTVQSDDVSDIQTTGKKLEDR